MQTNLERINLWCQDNSLQLNIKKCNVVSYTTKTCPIYFKYSLNNEYILRSDTFKDLGVIFDNKLSFTAHYNSIVTESSRMLGFIIRSTKEFSQVDAAKILYSCTVALFDPSSSTQPLFGRQVITYIFLI